MNPTFSQKLITGASLAFLFTAPLLAAEDVDILANAGAFRPLIKFSDTYVEKIVTIPGLPAEPGFPRTPATHEVIAAPQKVSAKVVANLEAFDFTEISETMPVEFSIGAFSFSGVLGDEESRGVDRDGFPKPFDPERKSATFYYYIEIDQPNGNTVIKKAGSIVFAWSQRQKLLVVTLTLANAIDSGAGDISASEFIGLADDGETGGLLAFVSEAVDVSLTFGTAQGTRTAYGKGLTKTSYKQFGSDSLGRLEELTLNGVLVQGAADVTAPVLTATVPAADEDGDGFVSFSGSVTDLPPGTFSGEIHPLEVLVYVNDDLEPFTAELEEPDAKGKSAFIVSDVLLSAPVNDLRIVAVDGSGNETVLFKKVTTTTTTGN